MDGLVYRGRLLVEIGAAGALGGLLAGGLGLGVLVVRATVAGLGPMAPLTAVGRAAIGQEVPWWTACGAGVATLSAVLVVFGVGFAAFVRTDTRPVVAGALGVSWGLFAWSLCTWALTSVAAADLADLLRVVPDGWLAAFVVAGAALAGLPLLQRRLLLVAMPRRPFVLVRGSRVRDSRSARS